MAEGKKKQKKSPWWYKLGILVFGAVFCVSAFMAGRDYLAAKKEADAFDSLSKLAADYAEEKAPADLPGEFRGDNGSGESGGVGRTLKGGCRIRGA